MSKSSDRPASPPKIGTHEGCEKTGAPGVLTTTHSFIFTSTAKRFAHAFFFSCEQQEWDPVRLDKRDADRVESRRERGMRAI